MWCLVMAVVFKYIKEQRSLLVLALVLATINQVFSLLDPQIFRLLIDNYAIKAGTLPREVFIKGVLLLLGGFIGVALVSRVAKNFQDYCVSVITQRVGTKMYANSVEHTLSLPYGVFEDQRSGEILQKLQKARLDTQNVITSFVNTVFLSAVAILFVLTYAFTVHWIIGAVYFLIIPILGVFTFALSRKIKEAQKSIVAESANLAGSTTETLRNVELVKSLGLEEQEINRLNKTNSLILSLELKKIKMIRRLSFFQGTLINGVRALLLFIILYFIFKGDVSLGQFLSLLFYSFFIFNPLSEFGTVASQYQEARASNEQLDKILEIPSQKKPRDAVVLGELKSIEFRNVSFLYNGNNMPSVNKINLKIEKGESVAFCGPSGSGKSTFIKLLVGLYEPTGGSILINGADSKKIDFDNLRKRIGFVSQETQLFAGTIRENLLFVNPSASDKDCLKVLEMASVMDILNRGGKGLDTKIGEGGIKISGGERQRLAIARALLREPDLIIFDEATSSLDSITEKAITKTIKDIIKLNPNLMVVQVAHRLSTISHADKIFVLQKGKIVEEGEHNSLIRKNGLYAAFWREQSAGENNES